MNILDHPLTREIQQRGMPFLVKLDELTISTLTLKFHTDKDLMVKHRYGEEIVSDFDGIVSVAWYCYLDQIDRYNINHIDIPVLWRDHFIRLGYITIENKTIEVVRINH